jgi:hypothetical protein
MKPIDLPLHRGIGVITARLAPGEGGPQVLKHVAQDRLVAVVEPNRGEGPLGDRLGWSECAGRHGPLSGISAGNLAMDSPIHRYGNSVAAERVPVVGSRVMWEADVSDRINRMTGRHATRRPGFAF